MKLRVNPYRIAIHALALITGGVLTAFLVFANLTDFDVDVVVPESVVGDTVEMIAWDVSSGVDTVDVYISYDNGLSYTLLETSIPVDESYAWEVPNISQDIRIRIDARNGSTKIRGRGESSSIEIIRDTASPADSLKFLEGFDPISTYYPNRSTVEAQLPDDVSIGDLIRTRDLSAVYFVGGDGKRHAFPGETIFFSWFNDFNEVRFVSDETMSSISLGTPVRVRPGTWLIKIQSSNKVYAVEPGGGLVSIPSEEAAIRFYGPDWNKRVIDIPSAYFTYYSLVSELCATCTGHPFGSILKWNGTNYYVGEDGTLRPFEGDGFVANNFKESFLVDYLEGDLTVGVPIRAHEEVLFDYQDTGR
mgnify:CR=1 FL=1